MGDLVDLCLEKLKFKSIRLWLVGYLDGLRGEGCIVNGLDF